ncbi:timeless protein-domain-containing protein [Cantharellus anzutake]|uniref:timeless protein-domain-containing protein n=1 Tax=Cantharellus anzutake TaxID=1750568 RepID=UPI0019071595|nr:timeless protein-domain-containing protein [Cantharellus anzutake]KAF8333073.1 timeless protein-domain-containing protein [Cantharellus anzutake]
MSRTEQRLSAEDDSPSRREILKPFIQSSVSALGGFQQTPVGRVYEMGDSCLGCLKDLKKFWRKDDTDDERTVARIFWETRVLPDDLVNIVLTTAGKGMVEDKRAIACADLITAMTWPIDIGEELQELDDELDAGTDYTTLLRAQLSYKASLLKPNVLKSLMDIMAGPMNKPKRDRTGRDGQVINVILHLFRNLAFIKDLPANAHASSDQAEYSSLQNNFISVLQEIKALELFLFLAANARDPVFNPYNALVLEIFYLLFRGVAPDDIIKDPMKVPNQKLSNLLQLEQRNRSDELRGISSRHSRFGTTVAINSGKDTFVMHKQKSLFSDTTSVMDMSKKKIKHKTKKLDELASFDELSSKALSILRSTAISFLESCFEAFFSSLLRDIKAERPKITEHDNIRLLRVVNWFIEYFVGLKKRELANASAPLNYEECQWRFEMVGEIAERGWIGYILKRIRLSMDDRPKQWTELRAGMDCLSIILSLLDIMGHSSSPGFIIESSSLLQHQMYYSGEILDISLECLRQYKEQSVAYLDSAVNFSYVLLRMLEKWAKNQGQMIVRKAVKVRRKKSTNEENEPVDTVSDEEVTSKPAFNEHLLTFEQYENRFAQEDITRACLAYLDRWKEFDDSDKVKRVVSLLHRQAVKTKAEGLFFKVSTLELFNRILAHQKDLPRDTPYKDLIQLVNFILRKFFKKMEEQPLLLIEAFFPKNRGAWKHFSTWQPAVGQSAGAEKAKGKRRPADVDIKKGWTDSEKLGIVVMCLVEDGRMDLIDWVRSSLMTVLGIRLAIVNETDGLARRDEDDVSSEARRAAALEKFEDFPVAYIKEEQAAAATNDPQLKLLLRLIDCQLESPEAEEFQWYFPAAITPDELQHHLDIISKYLETPLDLGGRKASEMLRKKRPTRTRRLPSDNELAHKMRRIRRKKQQMDYKSAEMIYDSDAELGDDEAFYQREAELRQMTQMTMEEQDKSKLPPPTMESSQLKRKRNPPGESSLVRTGAELSGVFPRKKRRGGKRKDKSVDRDEDGGEGSDGDIREPTPQQLRPRPRPRPRIRAPQSSDHPPSPTTPGDAPSPQSMEELSLPGDSFRSSTAGLSTDLDEEDDDEGGQIRLSTQSGPRRRQMIFSDSE